MFRSTNEMKLLAPMALIVIVAICALAGSLWIWAEQTDQASRAREETYLRLGTQGIIAQTHSIIINHSHWDEAVVATDNAYDAQWVEATYGEALDVNQGFGFSALLNGSDTPVFVWREGRSVDPSEYEPLRRLMTQVVFDEREEYRAQGDHPQMSALRGHSNAGRLVALDGHIYAMSAHPVVPDKTSALRHKEPYMLVGGIELTPDILSRMANQYLISDISILRPGQIVPKGMARLDIRDTEGRIITSLAWVPEAPGRKMFLRTLGPLLMLGLGLGLLTMLLLHHAHKTAQGLIASEARAKHMALHDTLTGLPNRTLFADRFNQACERARRHNSYVSVMCIGLDRFKDVNDTLGHVAGDELIRFIAQRLSGLIRASDTLARLGGDEFVIIQTDTDEMSTVAMARRVVECLAGNVSLESGQVFSSGSVGVTLIQDPDMEPAEALRQADLALYRAKSTGRGQCAFFETEMDATIKLRKSLETGLREAIHVDDIEVVYQPQADHFGNIVGVEALCRWTHPTRGPVSPSYFIPLAEECGLMMLLGELIMRRAMVDAKRWPGVKVAVNVSATQLKAPEFLESVRTLLSETGTSAQQIEIEITEGVLLADDLQSQNVLRDLRYMGFSIALDDFGTGYSSLSYLSRYPVDKIKIDRSFVSNLGTDPEAETVIKAIIKLSKALNLNIVAEGVETRQQKAILRTAGCGIIQGYIFSRPVASTEIDRMITAGRKLTLNEDDLSDLRKTA